MNRWNTRKKHLWIASWFQILFKYSAGNLWGLPNQMFWHFWGLFGTFSSYFVYYFSLSELCIGQGRHSCISNAHCVSGISVVRSEWANLSGASRKLAYDWTLTPGVGTGPGSLVMATRPSTSNRYHRELQTTEKHIKATWKWWKSWGDPGMGIIFWWNHCSHFLLRDWDHQAETRAHQHESLASFASQCGRLGCIDWTRWKHSLYIFHCFNPLHLIAFNCIRPRNFRNCNCQNGSTKSAVFPRGIKNAFRSLAWTGRSDAYSIAWTLGTSSRGEGLKAWNHESKWIESFRFREIVFRKLVFSTEMLQIVFFNIYIYIYII